MTIKHLAPLAAVVAGLTTGLTAVTTPASATDRHDPSPAAFTSGRGSGAPRDVPAGAPYYLHFGPTGLCAIGNGFDWGQVPAGTSLLFETTNVLAVKGSFDAETLVEIEPVDNGTATAFDDDVLVRVTSFGEGPDVVDEQLFPMWDTDGGGSIDDKATENEPQSLYLKRIELYATHNEFSTAVVNDTRVPMAASGWFGAIATGHNGYYGGDGPDCVDGSLQDDVIRGGAGDDWVRSQAGDDLIRGDEGNDTLQAGSGNDRLQGEEGIDRLEGGANDDCHEGGLDGQRDLLDDVDYFDFDTYIPEAGVVAGEGVDNIEILTEVGGVLDDMCM
jgi:Ca2+-binding RTX toxin-like protein